MGRHVDGTAKLRGQHGISKRFLSVNFTNAEAKLSQTDIHAPKAKTVKVFSPKVCRESASRLILI